MQTKFTDQQLAVAVALDPELTTTQRLRALRCQHTGSRAIVRDGRIVARLRRVS